MLRTVQHGEYMAVLFTPSSPEALGDLGKCRDNAVNTAKIITGSDNSGLYLENAKGPETVS